MNKINFIPANMPGCQMMSNLNYVPASIGIDAPLINTKIADTKYVPASFPSGPGVYNNSGTPQSRGPGCEYTLATSGHVLNINHLNYIPCSTSVAPGCPGAVESTVNKLSWWEEQSFFKYPFMLISAYYGMKWRDNFREFFNIPDDFIIIGDSGGFQNMTQNANLDPVSVLRWQEKHCQIGLTFDCPILKDDTKEIKQKKQINTVTNAYEALNNRQNDKLKLFAVIQGHDINEQKFIFDEYKKQGDLNKFDGFAIGGMVPIAGNLSLVTQILVTFLENVKEYNKPVHFFGISGSNIIPVIIYMQQKYNIPITFDSSSYGAGAIRREFWLDNAKIKIDFGKEGNNLKKLPCGCPVCSVCTPEVYSQDGSLSGGLISLHNLHETLKYVDTVKVLSDDINLFKEYIKKYCKEGVLRCIELVDYNLSNGIEKTSKKYNFIKSKEVSKTPSLMKFVK